MTHILYHFERSDTAFDTALTNFDSDDYETDEETSSKVALTQNQKVLLSRLSYSVFWALLVPDLYCFLYSFYFVVFKRVDWPKASQFFSILGLETGKFQNDSFRRKAKVEILLFGRSERYQEIPRT